MNKVFEARSHYIALDRLELAVQTCLTSNSETFLTLPPKY